MILGIEISTCCSEIKNTYNNICSYCKEEAVFEWIEEEKS